MSISGIQGQLLEVTVVGCHNLKDTEWISRQDPYVCLEYASTKYRTRTCTDGGKNPVFQEKFVFTLIEGLREINVVVWNSNTLSFDDYIGGGKMFFPGVLMIELGLFRRKPAGKPNASSVPSAPPYAPSHHPQVSMYSAPPASSISHLNPTSGYPPPPSTSYPPQPAAYPPPPTAYPSPSPYPYPPTPSAFPHYPYPPPSDQSTYPPPQYPPPPASAYPPPPYLPPHHLPPYPHSGHYPGMYPPPPY
ncbi:hypothetical protein RDABS01_000172 [Bienertia sinuspersici]